MSEAIRQESPLVERVTPERKSVPADNAGVVLREHALLGYINLRGDSDSADFLKGVESAAGVGLPLEPNTTIAGDAITLFWLGPDEWYLRTEAGAELEALAGVEQALADQHHAANDLTGNLTTIELSGPNARDVLEKGCTLDLHPRAFAPGTCAQTMLAKANVVIRPLGEQGNAFELIVRRSFADYLFVWLEDAADEFGFTVVE